jgi:hypothetical protein
MSAPNFQPETRRALAPATPGSGTRAQQLGSRPPARVARGAERGWAGGRRLSGLKAALGGATVPAGGHSLPPRSALPGRVPAAPSWSPNKRAARPLRTALPPLRLRSAPRPRSQRPQGGSPGWGCRGTPSLGPPGRDRARPAADRTSRQQCPRGMLEFAACMGPSLEGLAEDLSVDARSCL